MISFEQICIRLICLDIQQNSKYTCTIIFTCNLPILSFTWNLSTSSISGSVHCWKFYIVHNEWSISSFINYDRAQNFSRKWFRHKAMRTCAFCSCIFQITSLMTSSWALSTSFKNVVSDEAHVRHRIRCSSDRKISIESTKKIVNYGPNLIDAYNCILYNYFFLFLFRKIKLLYIANCYKIQWHSNTYFSFYKYRTIQ